jgi:ribosomal protein S18 acetylase RimI-like enzyme
MLVAAEMRSLIATDYRDVRALFQSIFDREEYPQFQVAWRRRDTERSLGLFIEDVLIGFTLVRENKLFYIGIDPECQAGGYGSQLLQEVIKLSKVKRIGLCLVPVNNTKVIHWYMRHGFKISTVVPSKEKGVPLITMNMNPYDLRSRKG